MSAWFTGATAAATALAPPEPETVDRVEAARAEVVRLHNELTALDNEMRSFKQQYRVTSSKYGVLLRVECGLLERQHVEQLWRALLQRRDRTVTKWHAALHEWSGLKTQAEATAKGAA